jgi:hypothetical protein
MRKVLDKAKSRPTVRAKQNLEQKYRSVFGPKAPQRGSYSDNSSLGQPYAYDLVPNTTTYGIADEQPVQ